MTLLLSLVHYLLVGVGVGLFRDAVGVYGKIGAVTEH